MESALVVDVSVASVVLPVIGSRVKVPGEDVGVPGRVVGLAQARRVASMREPGSGWSGSENFGSKSSRPQLTRRPVLRLPVRDSTQVTLLRNQSAEVWYEK